jgi:hypothetical protein
VTDVEEDKGEDADFIEKVRITLIALPTTSYLILFNIYYAYQVTSDVPLTIKLRRTFRSAATKATKSIQNVISEENATDYTVNSHYLVDCKVSKSFTVDGKDSIYSGSVDSYNGKYFHVVYDDGDEEQMSLTDVLKLSLIHI